MAMTKAEKQRMEDLEAELRMARALHWPTYPLPAAMTKAEILENLVEGGVYLGRVQMVARGYFVNTYERGRVSYGCSDGIHHSTDGDKTTTQHMGVMFAKEADAWRYLRIRKTYDYARHLADIDKKIAELS